MKIEGDTVYFDNGRVLYANKGIVGINPKLEVYEGHDGDLTGFGPPLTAEEAIDLADYMMDLWNKFRQQYE